MKSDSPKKTVKKTVRKSGEETKAPAVAKAASKSAKAKPAASEVKSPTRPPIPPILLEGDEPSNKSRLGGPGERFARGPVAPTPETSPELEELPESYGTQKLILTARDPHWLYAHWDLSQEQLRRYNSRSVDRHLVLRVYNGAVHGEPFREIHVHPESRNWFAHVGLGSTRFVAQLGYYMPDGDWVTVATSGLTVTPPDSISDDMSVWFETLPVEIQFDQLLKLVKQAVKDNVPLMEAVQQLRGMGFPGLPDARAAGSGRWTNDQERALAQIVSMDSVRRVWMGSLEITELIRRQFLQELASQAVAQLGESGSWSGAVSSLASPYGGIERQKGFWFNVNAELIIYGATEPNAAVTIGGRTIRLRPDGTFSYRFILPDGRYELPAIATSADGTDSRSAELQFSRATDYRGDVQAHPQDPSLKPPLARHVS
jgi:hypothetical protein